MQLWDISAPFEGTRTGPRVLFSRPEARVVLVDLAVQEELSDHRVRECAIIQIVRGSVDVTSGGKTTRCGEGALALLDPGESRTIQAVEESRLLLTLAPWTAPDHYHPTEDEDPHELPAHAIARPGL